MWIRNTVTVPSFLKVLAIAAVADLAIITVIVPRAVIAVTTFLIIIATKTSATPANLKPIAKTTLIIDNSKFALIIRPEPPLLITANNSNISI